MDYKPGVTRTWGVPVWEWSQPRGKHHWGRDVEHLGMWYEHLDLAVTEGIPDFLVNETINSLLLPKPGWTRFLSLTNDVLTQQGEDHCVSCRVQWDGPSGSAMSDPFSCPHSCVLWLRTGFLDLPCYPNHQMSKQHGQYEGCWGGSTLSNMSFSMATSFLRVSTVTLSA